MRRIFTLCTTTFLSFFAMAQVQVTNGPELDNDRDSKMNRMLGGDDKSFYCYRIRSKGAGTDYFIEKYSKDKLMPEFSVEIPVNEGLKPKIEGIHYTGGRVYFFIRNYDKETDQMSLKYLTVSPEGVLSEEKQEIINITSDHYEFVDFEIYPNPKKSKFLVKAYHKAFKTDSYKTDFILFDAVNMERIWTKTINKKIGNFTNPFMFLSGINSENTRSERNSSGEDLGFIDLYLDDKDNVFYAEAFLENDPATGNNIYKTEVSVLEASSDIPRITQLVFEKDYQVMDIEFSMTPNNELIAGGYIKEITERVGKDLVNVGIFSFKINVSDGSILAETVQIFDHKMLMALESSPKKSKYYKYKLDYIFAIGKDVYYVGEQYNEQKRYIQNNNYPTGYGTANNPALANSRRKVIYEYEYMDVIIAKLNADGKFEWVQNTPLRNKIELEDQKHVFKQYIATASSKAIYIMNNEHVKNISIYERPDFSPEDFKPSTHIHGTNFVCASIALETGAINRELIFCNEDYCFAPIQERNANFYPPSATEIFIQGKGNEIYIYTEDRGRDRFSKITLE